MRAAVFSLLLLLALPALADDVGIASARLVELADGGFALEVDIPPVLLRAIKAPVVPDRFTLAEGPVIRRIGVGLVVRYEFGGSDRPLAAEDVLLLPWARSAVLLTARWRDGSVQRAMFPRGAVGIRVPIETLKTIERSAAAVARQHVGDGLRWDGSVFVRILLVLGLVVAGGGWRALRLALVFAAGHAVAMLSLDLGVPFIREGFAFAVLGLGVALLARSVLRGDEARLWPLLLVLGTVDGLGMADRLARSGLGPGEMVPALFGAATGLDAALVVVTATLAGSMAIIGRPSIKPVATTVIGSLGFALVVATTVAGLRVARGDTIDPADRMAAARFEFGSGGTAEGAGTGGRGAAPPRRLDDPAMIFLTVEPMEVRVEVLLRLADFLEPLRIEGGPSSVVPVDVQGAIAARARRMVAQTIGIVIDGREAVPVLERTDFVSVAATGVMTRREPEPEPLETSILGVTLAYGTERPPSEINLGWRVFPRGGMTVTAVWTDPTGSGRASLTREQPTLGWANDLSSYQAPAVRSIEVNPPRWPLASMILLAAAIGIALGPVRRRSAWRAAAWVTLVAAIVLYPFARPAAALPGFAGWVPARTEAAEAVDGLLTNIYRAFDLRDEEAVYDRLAVSFSGDKLSEIYLENRRALELDNRGGARARVDEVEVLEVRSVRRDGEGGFRVEALWTVSGSVNHFGHVHYRQNRYDAALRIRAVKGVWKIHDIEILDERRVL